VAIRQKLNATANFIAYYRGGKLRKDITFATFDPTDAPDALLNVNLHTETVSLSFDGLVRDRKSTSPKKNTYTPALFGNRSRTTQRNVLLGVVARIISQLQGKECSDAIIFHESTRPSTVRLTDSIKNQARTVLSDLEALRRGSVPPLVLNEHCQVCEFRSRCHAKAVQDDNLSLLKGMNSSTIARFNSKGIFTVNQLSYTFKARRRPKRAKKSSSIHSLPLRALALREKKIFIHGIPEVMIGDTRVYLDIEGTPLEHVYYLIGVHVVSHGIESSNTFWADTTSPADQTKIFEDFLFFLNKYPDYNILHFGNYDRVALRRMQARRLIPLTQGRL
jgi:predicted RecB family nuclease